MQITPPKTHIDADVLVPWKTIFLYQPVGFQLLCGRLPGCNEAEHQGSACRGRILVFQICSMRVAARPMSVGWDWSHRVASKSGRAPPTPDPQGPKSDDGRLQHMERKSCGHFTEMAAMVENKDVRKHGMVDSHQFLGTC